MSDTHDDEHDPRWLMSAMADGEAESAHGARACAAWGQSPAAGEAWHRYHLIGDVLRNEELASPPGRDAAFLQQLRSRLADEPVPTPAPPARLPAARRTWHWPVALAAGVMAMATALSLAPWPGANPEDATVATAPRQALASKSVTPLPEAASVGTVVIRDAQLDRYLRAHRDYGAAPPASLPGGGGRRIETVSFQR